MDPSEENTPRSAPAAADGAAAVEAPAYAAPTVVGDAPQPDGKIAAGAREAAPGVTGVMASLPPSRALIPGEIFLGKYEIERTIGSGGMGSVVLARHRNLGAYYAIKVMHSSIPDRSAIERFKLEARTSAMVEHPNIVRVFDCGEHEGRCYIIMEYLRGERLRDRLARVGRLSVDETVRCAGVVCDVLSVMHEKGIVHRDLKPDNIMFQQQGGTEVLKILDFGIAKLATASMSGHLTETGTVVGTPAYMSPEQCRAGKIDGRSDVYSLGVILFQLLTGKLPFESDNVLTMMYLHVNQEPPAAHDWEPSVPRAVSDVVKRMMAKRGEDRFDSASSCAIALAEASGVPIALHPPSDDRLEGVARVPASGGGTIARAAGSASTGATVRPFPVGLRFLGYAGAALVALAIVFGSAVYLWSPVEESSPLAPPPGTPGRQANPGIPEGFVLVPGGPATIGSNPDDCRDLPFCTVGPDETPAHTVSLAPYYLSKYEVTNREYEEFVRSTGHKPPRHWRDSYPRGTDAFPVTNVTWNDAAAYARWRSNRDGIGFRLPTEAEWEHAARGGESRLFPWGDFWNANNVNGNKRRDEGSPLPVDQAPNNTSDVSPLGIFALGGNVSEWTASQFAAYPGSSYRPTPGDLGSKVARGGSFNLEPNSLRTSYRYWQPPDHSSFDLGFRLAADPPNRDAKTEQ